MRDAALEQIRRGVCVSERSFDPAIHTLPVRVNRCDKTVHIVIARFCSGRARKGFPILDAGWSNRLRAVIEMFDDHRGSRIARRYSL